ncbi:MAG: CDP-alcohol phosphatidyltransferase family protein [Candidatus Glassbacteria bacterium]|nr:CDP-alcohol phosphatidyltransferase family protein [Candidatus Glassbacteria bacterium]
MRNMTDKKVPIPYTRIRELNVLTLSNFLSLLRVLLLPAIFFLLMKKTPLADRWALGLMVFAGLTDILDGWIARWRGTISSFGKIIDPLADKIFMIGVAVFLILLRGFPVWLFALMLVRDVVIVGGGATLIRRYKIVFPSNLWGKLYSFFLALLITAYTLSLSSRFILPLQAVVVGFLVISMFSYSVIVTRYIKTHHRHQRRGRLRKANGYSDPESAAAVSGEADNPTAGR